MLQRQRYAAQHFGSLLHRGQDEPPAARVVHASTPSAFRQRWTTPTLTPHQKRIAAADSMRIARANSSSTSKLGRPFSPMGRAGPGDEGVGPARNHNVAVAEKTGRPIADVQAQGLVRAVKETHPVVTVAAHRRFTPSPAGLASGPPAVPKVRPARSLRRLVGAGRPTEDRVASVLWPAVHECGPQRVRMRTALVYRLAPPPITTKANRFGRADDFRRQGAFKCASASSRRRRRSALVGSSLSSQLRWKRAANQA